MCLKGLTQIKPPVKMYFHHITQISGKTSGIAAENKSLFQCKKTTESHCQANMR